MEWEQVGLKWVNLCSSEEQGTKWGSGVTGNGAEGFSLMVSVHPTGGGPAWEEW